MTYICFDEIPILIRRLSFLKKVKKAMQPLRKSSSCPEGDYKAKELTDENIVRNIDKIIDAYQDVNSVDLLFEAIADLYARELTKVRRSNEEG